MLDHERYLKQQPIFNDDKEAAPLDPALEFHPSALLESSKPRTIVTPFDTAGLITSLVAVQGSSLSKSHPLVLIGCADKSLRLYNLCTRELVHVFHSLHGNAAVRSINYIGNDIALTGGMDGNFIATDLATREQIGQEKAHSRFINATAWNADHSVLASGGFDGWIKLYRVSVEEGNKSVKFELLGSHKFMQIPTSVELIELDSKLNLLACTQDSTVMHFLSVPESSEAPPTSLEAIGKVNLLDAEYSSFVTFTPLHIAISSDRKRYAVATSHSPHLRIIVGRFGVDGIDLNLLAHAPQDKFSLPRITWSLDGKGIWCTGDDGVVRGIEVETGKLNLELRGAHDSKVSTIKRLFWQVAAV